MADSNPSNWYFHRMICLAFLIKDNTSTLHGNYCELLRCELYNLITGLREYISKEGTQGLIYTFRQFAERVHDGSTIFVDLMTSCPNDSQEVARKLLLWMQGFSTTTSQIVSTLLGPVSDDQCVSKATQPTKAEASVSQTYTKDQESTPLPSVQITNTSAVSSKENCKSIGHSSKASSLTNTTEDNLDDASPQSYHLRENSIIHSPRQNNTTIKADDIIKEDKLGSELVVNTSIKDNRTRRVAAMQSPHRRPHPRKILVMNDKDGNEPSDTILTNGRLPNSGSKLNLEACASPTSSNSNCSSTRPSMESLDEHAAAEEERNTFEKHKKLIDRKVNRVSFEEINEEERTDKIKKSIFNIERKSSRTGLEDSCEVRGNIETNLRPPPKPPLPDARIQSEPGKEVTMSLGALGKSCVCFKSRQEIQRLATGPCLDLALPAKLGAQLMVLATRLADFCTPDRLDTLFPIVVKRLGWKCSNYLLRSNLENYMGALSSHSFALVTIQCSGRNISYLVDFNFKDLFDVARPTTLYRHFLSALPNQFVGTLDDLRRAINIIGTQANQSLQQQQMTIPPWRRTAFLFGCFERATADGPQRLREDAQLDAQATQFLQSQSGLLSLMGLYGRTLPREIPCVESDFDKNRASPPTSNSILAAPSGLSILLGAAARP